MATTDNEQLQSSARAILEKRANGASENDPSSEDFWHDLRAVLRELTVNSENASFARGKFVAGYVGITQNDSDHRPESVFNAHLTLFPYEERWSLVRGVEVALVGRDRNENSVSMPPVRIGWEGGVTFPDLPPGEYQLLPADVVQAATRQAVRDLFQTIGVVKEGVQRIANALVTIEIQRNKYDGYEELQVAIRPHAESVDMSGFPVVIATSDLGEPYMGMTDSDCKVIFPKIPAPFTFTNHPGITAGDYVLASRGLTSPTINPGIQDESTGFEVHCEAERHPLDESSVSPKDLELAYSISRENDGYYIRAHYARKTDRAPRLAYALVNEATGKVVIVKRKDELVPISGEMVLEKRKEGDWYGETELPICTVQELPRPSATFQLHAYIIFPEGE